MLRDFQKLLHAPIPLVRNSFICFISQKIHYILYYPCLRGSPQKSQLQIFPFLKLSYGWQNPHCSHVFFWIYFMSSSQEKKNRASLSWYPLGQQLQMKSKQSTCQDKIRLPQSTRFDPIPVSDLVFSCAHHHRITLAGVLWHAGIPKAGDAFCLWTRWEKAGDEIRYLCYYLNI